MTEKTAAIGVQLNGWSDDAQKLRDSLNKSKIKFAENTLTMTMTTIYVKNSDFNDAIAVIADTGFEILN